MAGELALFIVIGWRPFSLRLYPIPLCRSAFESAPGRPYGSGVSISAWPRRSIVQNQVVQKDCRESGNAETIGIKAYLRNTWAVKRKSLGGKIGNSRRELTYRAKHGTCATQGCRSPRCVYRWKRAARDAREIYRLRRPTKIQREAVWGIQEIVRQEIMG
jgi:hypothetical protein